jgi:hypothetical protein
MWKKLSVVYFKVLSLNYDTGTERILLLLTAIGLSSGGSVYCTCKQNMKLVSEKFRFNSGGLNEKHVVANWNFGSHLSICL